MLVSLLLDMDISIIFRDISYPERFISFSSITPCE
jgi:hypothetical protein